jgi:hypothetical protein
VISVDIARQRSKAIASKMGFSLGKFNKPNNELEKEDWWTETSAHEKMVDT